MERCWAKRRGKSGWSSRRIRPADGRHSHTCTTWARTHGLAIRSTRSRCAQLAVAVAEAMSEDGYPGLQGLPGILDYLRVQAWTDVGAPSGLSALRDAIGALQTAGSICEKKRFLVAGFRLHARGDPAGDEPIDEARPLFEKCAEIFLLHGARTARPNAPTPFSKARSSVCVPPWWRFKVVSMGALCGGGPLLRRRSLDERRIASSRDSHPDHRRSPR